jgi:hypothetical protein
MHAVVDEVEASVTLARRRSALRRHLAAVKRRAVIKRIRGLEEEIEKIEEGSTLRASFEAALESRRGELATYDEIHQARGLINALPESIDRRGIAERRGNPPPSSLGNKLLTRQPRMFALVKNDAFASCAHSGGLVTLQVSSSGGNVAVRTYPQNLKSLALLAVLILCHFAFTLVSIGEAQAEERLSQTAQRPMSNGEAERPAILDGKGADQAALQTSLVEMALVETESIETTMTDASPPGQSLSSPVGSAPPASKSEPTPQQYAVVIRNGEVVESDPDLVPAPQKAQPAPAPELSDGPSPGKPTEAEPQSAPTPGGAAAEPYSGSSETEVPAAPVSGHVPPPVPFLSEGEGVPTSSPAPSPFEEDPDAGFASPSPRALVEPIEQQAPSAAERMAGPAPSRMLDQLIPPLAQQGVQRALPISSAVEAASSGAVQATFTQTLTTVTDAAAGVLETLGNWTDYHSASGETPEGLSEGTTSEPLAPQLPSPFEGSSVSSSHLGVSGQAGPWGGYVVLLLGVLVSGLVLLLRDGFLRWAAWDQPKPSSALLLPLERPG